MSIVKQAVINQLAKEVAKGNTCYVNRRTSKITIIDNSAEDENLVNQQVELLQQIKKKIDNYVKIEEPDQDYQLNIMKEFLDELTDRSVSKQLSNALNRKNPMRNFKMAVASDMDLNNHWSNYKSEEYQRWVANVIIDAYNY